MTIKQRLFLISAICIIFGGLLVSYKSFELNKQFRIQSENEKSIEISQWVAQSIEQKITHLESSVSYLDASTVETLKRMGARYFAYAYQKEGQWKIKWKVLGPLDRKGIVKEVNAISFKELSAARRTWDFNKAGEHILISPVELAGSHQLKNGFLVFGLNEAFFSSIGGVDQGISLMSAGEAKLYSKTKTNLKALLNKIKTSTEAQLFSEEGEDRILSAYFSKPTQMWVTRAQAFPGQTYISSSMFTYFLLAILLSLGFLALIVNRFLTELPQAARKARINPDRVFESLRAVGGKLNSMGSNLKIKPRATVSDDRPMVEKELGQEVIGDFSGFLDDVISLERNRLKKHGVDIRTQVEDETSILCTPQHVTDFLRRLINNSIQCLKSEDEKRIQIELVRLGDAYQLIYLDTRRSHYPSGEEPSVFLQDESSLENIDGLISYGTWLFGDSLTVAKDGFCLSIDLKRTEEKEINIEEAVVTSIDVADRIEIRDEDTINLQFEKIESTNEGDSEAPEVSESVSEPENFSSQSIEDIVSSFEMKDFSFDSETTDAEASEETIDETPVDEKGFFEFDTGQFKIKIRSPKTKKDTDVSR